MSESCTLAIANRVATVTLARPEVHNAFDDALIARLAANFAALDADAAVRAVILAAEGKSFCAGADLNWMRRMAGFSHAENVADARALAQMLDALAGLSKPTIARVHGAALGGGVGLVAACDVAIGSDSAQFALAEARLGLIPATISPYVIGAIGERAARRYFLTAERFGAVEAVRIGLLHEAVAADRLDARIAEVVASLLEAGPAAQRESKRLIRAVAHRPIDGELLETTARHIADVRASPEGREGVGAFLERRKPAWTGGTE